MKGLIHNFEIVKRWATLLLACGVIASWCWAGGDNKIKDEDDEHAPGLAGYNGLEASEDCEGMARWWVSEPFISLWMEDEPLSYQPSKGAPVTFHLSYTQRDKRDNTPSVFNVGPQWECSWMSRIYFEGLQAAQCVPGAAATNCVNYLLADLYLAGGGVKRYTNADCCSQAEGGAKLDPYAQTWLRPVFNSTPDLVGFALDHADGRKELYQYHVLTSNGETYFLSERIDPVGFSTRFEYESQTEGVVLVTRLVRVIDVDGRTNYVRYADTNFSSQITSVEDAYGRTNFLYYDASGYLTNIVDPEGLFSRFVYDDAGAITNLTTPYGVTSFQVTGGNSDFLGGQNVINRSLQITTPDNATQLYLYMDDSSDFLPTHYYNGLTPTYSPLGTLSDDDMRWRNSFYWNKRQFAALSTNTPTEFSSADFEKGRMRQWLRVAHAPDNTVSPTLNCERSPSPDGAETGQLPGTIIRERTRTITRASIPRWRRPSGCSRARSNALPGSRKRARKCHPVSGNLRQQSSAHQ